MNKAVGQVIYKGDNMSHYLCKECHQFPDECKCNKATKEQVDGNHYSKLNIQPLELAYSINASPCFNKLAKYITRDKDDKVTQFDKAIHCIRLEKELKSDKNTYGLMSDGYELVGAPYLAEIKSFCNQFKYSEVMYQALRSMHEQAYEEATIYTKELKALVTSWVY